MGLSASQARFLQLTARKSNVEYQAQQITFQRLQLSNKLESASMEYQDKMSNRKLVYKFNNGTGTTSVDLNYQNYKNYMNQQLEGLQTAQEKLYLVSSSGNKIIVASEEEMLAMMNAYNDPVVDETEEPKTEAVVTTDDENAVNNEEPTEETTASTSKTRKRRQLTEKDFLIVEDVNDPDKFRQCVEEGVFLFAKLKYDADAEQDIFEAHSWENIGNGVVTEEYDKQDDAAAQAKYEKEKSETQKKDKALEMELDKLETEREAIQTEMDSISKVIDDNIEDTFKIFG